jgi:hypothetical protein
MKRAEPAADVLRRKPITGIGVCCARTASGHAAAAPPRAVKNFVVRCSLPCDPPVGGHSCNGGMIPRFRRAVCDYFTLERTAGASCTVKILKAGRDYPCRKTRARFQGSSFVIVLVSVRGSDLINVRFGLLCGLKSDISRGPRKCQEDSCTAAK